MPSRTLCWLGLKKRRSSNAERHSRGTRDEKMRFMGRDRGARKGEEERWNTPHSKRFARCGPRWVRHKAFGARRIPPLARRMLWLGPQISLVLSIAHILLL